ncbi:hypothetical protein [Streptococcus pluranimalium]|uniref:Uncharacterized protein n=1 Tax=Streptococcus pluranimalium TaxID=82348 RepID=A0A345VJK6_9STRE|nr:hypothetical protein [Streptococcus pluranimalium]AXJ12908.1 hypothetical protein Sp14A_09870 [Streptococcus pluranimalium]
MIQGDSPGQAIASSVMTTTVSSLVGQGITIGLYSMGILATATPVGWAAVGIGALAGVATSYMYNNDFMGMKTVAQDLGKGLDKTFDDIGNAFSNVGDFLWGN